MNQVDEYTSSQCFTFHPVEAESGNETNFELSELPERNVERKMVLTDSPPHLA